MNFSAKKLLSYSASKLCWELLNQDKVKPFQMTPWIMEGQRYQQNVFSSLGKNYETEMCGCFVTEDGDNIYFSHDIVQKDGLKIIETKCNADSKSSVIDLNYFNKSCLQCALYDALTRFSSPHLNKSKFAINEGDKNAYIKLQKEYEYFLSIDGAWFKIQLIDPYPIIKFVTDKINAVKKGYESCRAFDSIWKGNEVSRLSHCFKIIQI